MLKHAALASATIAALSASSFAQFSVTHLGTFGPAVTFRMNTAGQIAGDYQLASVTTAYRYDVGTGITPRTLPAGTTMSAAYGINTAGACIGQATVAGSTYAMIWSPSNVYTQLTTPAGSWTYSTGTDINDSNVACGFVTEAIVGNDPNTGWRWDAVNGYVMLPQLLGNFSIARDINNSGVICGTAAATEIAPPRAVIWNAANQVIAIDLLPGATSNSAQAINDLGVVVGDSNGSVAPWRYTPGSGVVALAKFGNEPAVARGVNNSGWVVGYARQFGEWRTVVWDPAGVIYKLEDFAGPNHYFPADGSYPIAISDNNDLVVYAYDFTVSGDPRAVRFHFGYPAPCTADVDGSGDVEINDLLEVINTWGACANPNDCPADIDPAGGDDQVNINDLLAVINSWGDCP